MSETRFRSSWCTAASCVSSSPAPRVSTGSGGARFVASPSISRSTRRTPAWTWPVSKDLRPPMTRWYATWLGPTSKRQGPSPSSGTDMEQKMASAETWSTLAMVLLLRGSFWLTMTVSPCANRLFGKSKPPTGVKRTRNLKKWRPQSSAWRPGTVKPKVTRRSMGHSVRRSRACSSSSFHSMSTKRRKCPAQASDSCWSSTSSSSAPTSSKGVADSSSTPAASGASCATAAARLSLNSRRDFGPRRLRAGGASSTTKSRSRSAAPRAPPHCFPALAAVRQRRAVTTAAALLAAARAGNCQ
mmetsp:Transcript_55859/g.179291  ORF Transcript_55859/g.179291 Transcript_55859/m.179291 type:complete len:300 (-) Transcript_55859:225-1124(-)